MAAQGDRGSVSNVREQIIGTWELVSAEEHMTDGSKRPFPIMGASGKGYLMYSADGYMFAAGMNPDRPAWKDGNKPTDTEKLRAIEGFFAYYGRYEIDEAKQLFLQCAFRRCQHFFGLLCRQHCSIAGLTHALLT